MGFSPKCNINGAKAPYLICSAPVLKHRATHLHFTELLKCIQTLLTTDTIYSIL